MLSKIIGGLVILGVLAALAGGEEDSTEPNSDKRTGVERSAKSNPEPTFTADDVAEVTIAGMSTREFREVCDGADLFGRDVALEAFKVGFDGGYGISADEALDALLERC